MEDMMHTSIRGKRLFVALLISKTLQEEILRSEMAYVKLPVRWLTGKNLHVTLIPPWHAADDTETRELLAEMERVPEPLALSFHRVTFGPDPHAPRLIWAEGNAPPELLALKTAIETALGVKPEYRPFRLHLTLARFREEDFSSFPVRELDERVAWRDTVRSFVLMESHLTRGGADYEILAEFPFQK